MDLDTEEQPKRHMAQPGLEHSLGELLGQNLPQGEARKSGTTMVPVRVPAWCAAVVQGTFKTRTSQEVSTVSPGSAPRSAVGHLDPQFRHPTLEGLRGSIAAVNAPPSSANPDGQGMCLRCGRHKIKGLVHWQNQASTGGEKQPLPRMGAPISGTLPHILCGRTCAQGPGTPIQNMEAIKARTTSLCARALLR